MLVFPIGDTTNEVTLKVKGVGSQTANLLTIQQSDGTEKLTVSASGVTTASSLSATSLTLNSVAVTSTAAELNILDGVTAAAELNILDGVTATTAELNILTVSHQPQQN